jgi:prolycopene isomerase
MPPEIQTQCDVVVIGAGISGLTAAALLSKAGLHVVVVEAESSVGGCIAGFERKGFKFDSAIHWLNQCGEDGFIYRIFNYLDVGFPKCKALTRIRRIKGDSFDYLLTNNPDDLRDQLIKDFPDAAKGIRKLFACGKILGDRLHLYTNLMRTRETMSLLELGLYGLKMGYWVLPMFRHIGVPVEKGLYRYFKNSNIKKILSAEEEMLGVLIPIGWAYSKDYQAPPVGGSRAFPIWLNKLVESSGSKVLLKHRVEKVLVDTDKAVGISLKNGGTICSRFVLAACDVETLYEKMLPKELIPLNLRKRLHDADLYDSAVMINIGLDCEAADLGFNEEMISLSRDDVPKPDRLSGDPLKVNLCILSSSLRDPTLAPKGKGTLTIFCHAKFDYKDNWKTGNGLERGSTYNAFKREYANILIGRVEKTLAPELGKHIEVMDIATPITYWRYTGNRYGSMMGARPTKKNIKSKIAHYRTPVKNLLLGGHWSEYGGGLPIAVKAGTNTSLLILREIAEIAYKELRDLMDGKL